MKIELDCREVSRLLSEAHESPLPANPRARLRLHLVLCEACRDVDEQFNFLSRAMRKLGPQERPEP
jgi:predicted anti-sigma-YlaC factor YlaD